MNQFALFTDSSCDLPLHLAEEMELTVLPLTLHMDGSDYKNYLDERDITYPDFYAALPKAQSVKTSATNTQAFIEAMEPVLDAGQDILYIGFSSALSGTCNAGFQAAAELREKYPDRKIYCVDSLCASMGEGLLVTLADQKRRTGASIEEVRDYVEDTKLHVCHWFTVDDLNHLKKGGRVSATAAFLGTMLGIKPIMHVDNAGRLIPVDKQRGRKASVRRLADEMQRLAINPAEQKVYISHGGCEEDAKTLANIIRERMGTTDITIGYVGPVIGAHSGPGTLALFFLGTER
ncbi:MAG: DegV family protein [Clostridia bacterium]|nr:DegV family protein [Clostridia bacterium]